jgi:WD40 repeat protein
LYFDHNVWHEGEVLTKGEKFVLRSDILYSKDITTEIKMPFSDHLGYIWSLLRFDQHTIISGGRDKEVKVWNADGKLKMSLKAHQSSILCIEKLNDETFITGSRDQEIIVWKDFKIYKKLKIHEAVVLSLCSLTTTTFVSSSGDGTIKISTIDGSVLKTFQAHENWVWKVIKLSETHIASCSEDHSIKIWNIENEEIIQTFQEDCAIISLIFNSETKQLISGNLQGELTIRTLDSNFNFLEKTHIKAHLGIIRTIKFIDTEHFVTGAEDNTVKVWNTRGSLIKVFEHQNFVQDIQLLDNKTILSASYDGSIKTWEL